MPLQSRIIQAAKDSADKESARHVQFQEWEIIHLIQLLNWIISFQTTFSTEFFFQKVWLILEANAARVVSLLVCVALNVVQSFDAAMKTSEVHVR